jgi:hypothetical protein
MGIVVRMYWDDHPPPHFHVENGDDEAVVHIEPLEIADGRVGAVTRRLVVAWAKWHRCELLNNWARAQAHQPLRRIEPPR